MKIVPISEQNVIGMSIRTTNANEMNPDTAKISNLYKNFDDNVAVDYKKGSRVYGLYYDYESDTSGEFSVFAGTDQLDNQKNKELKTRVIPKGKYLVFEAKGKIPEAVITTWGEIWAYFSSAEAEHTRTYKTDFEFYKNETDVDITIQ